jgi:hypothetical protein
MKKTALALFTALVATFGTSAVAFAYPPGGTTLPPATTTAPTTVAPTTVAPTTVAPTTLAPTTTLTDGLPPAPTVPPTGGLPPTGSDGLGAATIALGLLTLGGLLTVAAVRRRQSAHA